MLDDEPFAGIALIIGVFWAIVDMTVRLAQFSCGLVFIFSRRYREEMAVRHPIMRMFVNEGVFYVCVVAGIGGLALGVYLYSPTDAAALGRTKADVPAVSKTP